MLHEGSWVNSVAFRPDGGAFAVGDTSGDAEVLRQDLWSPNFNSLTHVLCDDVGRNMTIAEWAANVPDQPYRETCPGYPAGG